MLIVSPAPHIHAKRTTQSIMADVCIALIPAVIVSVLFYGWHSLLIFAVSCLSCCGIECVVTTYLLKKKSTCGDLSALVTAILLALNLPPSCPWWIAIIGAVVAIGIGKLSFGGLGQNLFNPAILARVFLLVSFPVQMTNWTSPKGFIADAFTGATPLGMINEGIMNGESVSQILSKSSFSPVLSLFAEVGGSAGEIADVALLIGFIYLLCRRVIKPYITLSIWASVALFSFIFNMINPDLYTGPLFNLLTGGVLLGSIFMATDYVTSPMSNLGGVIFGLGIGIITMLIRYFGAYPEGVSFAILIMNAFVPLINSAFKQRKYGRK
ncbi:MAG: RnfABCDGE type electron transport complex subunit D [Bacteroidales bacterium]|nr:RnfABCDGE type electron transport complex subunit D [Bacteroidales bacterium]